MVTVVSDATWTCFGWPFRQIIEYIFRDFPNIVFVVKKTGGEVGDQHHSKNFPPKVVNTMYDVFMGDWRKYFKSFPFAFPNPFTVITDKNESHHRKRLLIGLRLLDFNIDDWDDFV